MAEKELKTRIGLRRDSESNFSASFKPLLGEVLLVDTTQYGLRVKIGDGTNTYANLNFLDNNNNVVLSGYYLNKIFYSDSTYTKEFEKQKNKIYIDRIEHKVYIYVGDSEYEYKCVDEMIPGATAEHAGILKLYTTYGYNEDGTMTQKAITEGIDNVLLDVDDDDPECLVLSKPW